MSRPVKRSILINGMTRTYLRVAPAGDATDRALVLVLHGSNQSAKTIRRYADRTFDSLASRGAVVAYLDGFRGDWNDARVMSISPARRNNVDDVAFVSAAIDDLVAEDNVDRTRVFIVGFSAGGYMTIRVIHEIPHRIAGAGLISATHAEAANFIGSQYISAPMAVTLFHGTSDAFVKYNGERARKRGLLRVGGMLSAPATAEYFAHRNGIQALATQRRFADDVWETVYEEGDRPRVRLFTITGSGHTVPGSRGHPIAGRSTRSIVAAQVLADHWGLPAPEESAATK